MNEIVPNQQNLIIYNTLDGKVSVTMMARDGNVWMNQKQMAQLFATSIPNVNIHISNILKENEIDKESVIKDYLITATDGKHYNVTFYSLDMVLAVGFRVKGKRGTQFRIWANQHLKEFIVKGFVLDDERLKNPDGRHDYFDELLERIRDIRASEKRFYQKLRDLFALSSDYDSTDKATQMFFAETQNKLLYAVTHQTAAEIIVNRADASQPNMALTSWKGSVVRKQDIYIAKNYLHADEIDMLNRLTTLFLESAEIRVKERFDLTINYWRQNVDQLLQFQNKDVLRNAGSITSKEMEAHVLAVYEQFDQRRKQADAQLADQMDNEELKQLEQQILERK